MLVRVAGKLSSGENFNTRVDAPDLAASVARAWEALTVAGHAKNVVSIAAKPMDGKSSISIGKARVPKSSKKSKK